MARKLHILVIIFCLGVFIIPKQNVFAQIKAQSCCTTTGLGDCCPSEQKDPKPCHGEDKKSCGSDCSSCRTCTSTSVFSSVTPELLTVTKLLVAGRSDMDFCYLSPDFSDPTARIWQPPKIG